MARPKNFFGPAPKKVCPSLAWGDLRVTTRAVERRKGTRNLIAGKKLTNGIDSLIFVVYSHRGLISATHASYPVHVNLNEFEVNMLGFKKKKGSVPPSTGHEGPDEE